MTCAETCLIASRDCDAIVHTAAKAGVWGAWSDYYQTNTAATIGLLDAAAKNRVTAFVHTSSPSVTFDGHHQSGVDETVPYPTRWLCYYPQTKALAEQAVMAAAKAGQVLTCALRPHLIWGLNDPYLFPRVIERTMSGRFRRVGSGDNWIDVVHVDNAARAHVLAVTRLLNGDQRLNGQALFITDGKPVIHKIRETKGTVDIKKLRFEHEKRKIRCAQRYFAALGIDYRPISDTTQERWKPETVVLPLGVSSA